MVETGQREDVALRAGGSLLSAAALVWVVSLVFHPPPPADVPGFMSLVEETGVRWSIVHWGAAVALSLFVATSLVVLTSRSRLTSTPWSLAAWAVLPVASLWVLTTAVAEATVISQAATEGDTATFEAWHVFAEGRAMGFLAIAFTIAVIAGSQARRTEGATPAWAAWVASAAGAVGVFGWILGPILGMAVGGLLFVVSSVVFGLWLLWFGIGLTRQAGLPRTEDRPAPHTDRMAR